MIYECLKKTVLRKLLEHKRIHESLPTAMRWFPKIHLILKSIILKLSLICFWKKVAKCIIFIMLLYSELVPAISEKGNSTFLRLFN